MRRDLRKDLLILLKQQRFRLSVRFGFFRRPSNLGRIQAPNIAFTVVGNPNRAKAEANGISALVVAVLFQNPIALRINSDDRSSARRRPYVSAAESDVATGSRDFGFYGGDHPVLFGIDTSDTAVRLTEDPDRIVADRGETRRCSDAYFRNYRV